MANDEVTRKRFLKLAVGAVAATAAGGAGAVALGEAKAGEHGEEAGGGRRRWGMVVDTTKCKTDCTACIDACHLTHNVPNIGNLKEEVKWVWKEEYEHVLGDEPSRLSEAKKRLPILTLCNQCDHPPCVRVCPTQATFKRGDGIVMMDFHRCIGCRFCMAACPYGSRSFNFKDPEPFIAKPNPSFPHRTRGVVEKCNMCAERIDRGLQPLCVGVCPSKALTFGDLNDPTSAVRKLIDEHLPRQRKPELGTEPSVYYIT
jgi:Fe-S-cluster-containing dehydrogenase component